MSDDQQNVCFLSQFDLFEEIPEAELKERASSMHGKKFDKGEMIYTPHQEDLNIYMLQRGEVMLYQSHDGKKETFDTVGPGTLFGNFTPDNPNPSHFAEAARDCEVCVFPIKDFLEVLKHKPELMLKFVQTMAERLQDYERRFRNNLQTAKETIFAELKRLKHKRSSGFFRKFFGDEGQPLRLTHEQIADITGLNRVTVTRSLKELREEGLVSVDADSGVIELHEEKAA